MFRKKTVCTIGIVVLAVSVLGTATAEEPSRPISRVLFGSCVRQDQPMPIFEKIVAARPELFVFVGDNIYADTTDMDVMRAKYARLKANEGFAKLLRSCPVLATWDDHDYGANDAGADYAKKEESQRIFVDFWGDRADSPRRRRPGVYDAHVYGPAGKRLQVILLDTRYFRGPLKPGGRQVGGLYVPSDDESSPMLGETQFQWLEEQLRKPAEVRIIATSIQCLASAAGQETWSNLPHARRRLLDLIGKTKAGGVLLVSGDRHWAELSSVTEGVPYPLYDLTSSSLNQLHPRGTPTKNKHRAVKTTYHRENFGAVLVDWEQADPAITLQVRDVNGEVRIEKALRLSELQPARPKADEPARRFSGNDSPVQQGWVETHDKPKAAVAKGAEASWRIEDDDDDGPEGLYYRAELTDAQRDLARRDGFAYRWRVRIPEETGAPTRAIGAEVCVCRSDGSQRLRFGVQLGRAGGQLLGRVHTGTHGGVEGGLRVERADGFHDWELLFEGASRTLNLRVDGRLLLSAICDNNDTGHHLVFGSRATGTGTAEWQRVAFFAGLSGDARPLAAPAAPPFRTEVYVSGRDEYFAYRIPALLVTPQGTLLAFAEGRKSSLADLGNNDMVLKRSTDGGKTWGPLRIIYDEGEATIGNPTPVMDRATGRIWLLFGRDAQRVLAMHSDDDGETWSEPADITSQVSRPEWKFYGVGPGVGVQLREGKHAGRMVIPAYHRLTEHKNSSPYAHLFYSDDGGRSWQAGEPVGPESCECQVAETAGGGLILNARNHWARTGKRPERGGKRIVARSSDGGQTWSEPVLDEALIEPTCQASLLRYSRAGDGTRSRLLFANPAAVPTGAWGGPRHRLTVRLSYDDGRTWPVSKLVEPGAAAYSCLARLPDGRIGVLYESGGYKQLTFAALDLKWLGEPSARKKKTHHGDTEGHGEEGTEKKGRR